MATFHPYFLLPVLPWPRCCYSVPESGPRLRSGRSWLTSGVRFRCGLRSEFHWGTQLALLWVVICSAVLPGCHFPFRVFGMWRVSLRPLPRGRLRLLRQVAQPHFSHASRHGPVLGQHGG